MTESPIPIVRVSVTELRQRFNHGAYWEKAKSGELKAVVERDRHPALPLAREPFCTRSQQVSYYDALGNEIARVHQYLRTDGSIGASGKPDPKRLYEGGKLYRMEKTKSADDQTNRLPDATE